MRLKRWQRTALILLAVVVTAELGLKVVGKIVLEKHYSHAQSGPYREGDINILCLGESTTLGLWVKPEESYPKQLEAMLRKHYGSDRIRVIVPPHIGQNSSQQANRIVDYLERYKPRLVITMSGANNEWAMSESHIPQFLELTSLESLALRFRILIDESSVFRVVRYAYLSVTGRIEDFVAIGNRDNVWGHPSKSAWPPPRELTRFAKENKEAFVEMLGYDLELIAMEAKKRSTPVVVMTYPINPDYLSTEDFKRYAITTGAVLIENDSSFAALLERGRLQPFLERDNWHPSALGYGIVARNVFAKIVDENLLDRTPASRP